MGVGEWVLTGLVVLIFAFVILRPDRWRKRDRTGDGDGGFYAADRPSDDDTDFDADGN
jgi:hypothetical protein